MARIRATKEQRAKEKEQGLTGMRRLAFVKDLIYGRGFTIQRIASRVPMTAQGLWWVFDVPQIQESGQEGLPHLITPIPF